MTTSAVLVKYGEIALRGGNRRIHENILLEGIKKRLAGLDASVRKDQGRFFVELGKDADARAAASEIAGIFGIASCCPCIKTENNDFEHIKKLALEHMRERYPRGGTFKVEASRADKSYPLNSQRLSADLGAFLLENIPDLKVRMKNPDIRLTVEIRSSTYIYSETMKGPGGLPSGSGGKAVLLLSGGFDSPVAGYMMARRGVKLVCVYFHSPPYTSERAKEKAVDLAKRLSAYTGGVRLYIAPFTDLQLYLNERSPEVKLTIFLKRAMLKAANQLAAREKAQALITGDSVGQVASQTMHALTAVDSAADYPVLRPLCAMDKLDIINLAEKIGTHDISARPFADCCTLFVPKHPETKPKRSIIENMESRFEKLDALVAACADNAEVMDL
ncbi:MAG: tRNA 4-thiouridine(8) synthase ThiI [Defluviitaleaceae bacterium]|nr:tRNA 4-thiouridine(8) synthase ThiI [Defluviitaleaceae bacterium]